MRTHERMLACAHTQTHTQPRTHARARAGTQTHVSTRARTRTNTRLARASAHAHPTCAHTHSHPHTHTHAHAHTPTHTYTHTHPHTRTPTTCKAARARRWSPRRASERPMCPGYLRTTGYSGTLSRRRWTDGRGAHGRQRGLRSCRALEPVAAPASLQSRTGRTRSTHAACE